MSEYQDPTKEMFPAWGCVACDAQGPMIHTYEWGASDGAQVTFVGTESVICGTCRPGEGRPIGVGVRS